MAGRRMAQPLYPQLRKYRCVLALTLVPWSGMRDTRQSRLNNCCADEHSQVLLGSLSDAAYQPPLFSRRPDL
jgi:hypothetical protein